ncbi:MAG: acyltransferase [Clostridium sp.]
MIRKRIDEVDILRGLAFLAVVLQHSLASFIYNPNISMYGATASALLLNIIRFAVPVFVFMTGFSLYYSERGISYIVFIKKKFMQIILPYMLWTLIYDILMFFIMGMKTKTIVAIVLEYINYVFTGTGFYHLWYMILIIQFFVFYPVFKALINKNYKFITNTIVLIIFLIVHMFLLYWYNFYAGAHYDLSTGIIKKILGYSDRLFIMWMFYFVLGSYFAIYFERMKNILWKIRYISSIGFLISLTYVMNFMIKTATTNDQGGYIINHFLGSPLNTIMFPLLFFSIIVLYPISLYILNTKAKLGSLLIEIGKYSFGAYLIHALILHYVNALIKICIPWLFIEILVSFIIGSIISIYIIKKLSNSSNPFILTLVGMRKRK